MFIAEGWFMGWSVYVFGGKFFVNETIWALYQQAVCVETIQQ